MVSEHLYWSRSHIHYKKTKYIKHLHYINRPDNHSLHRFILGIRTCIREEKKNCISRIEYSRKKKTELPDRTVKIAAKALSLRPSMMLLEWTSSRHIRLKPTMSRMMYSISDTSDSHRMPATPPLSWSPELFPHTRTGIGKFLRRYRYHIGIGGGYTTST